MCDEYWERELERRRRLLASEDEIVWLDKLEIESNSEPNAPIIVPALPSLEEKRRGARAESLTLLQQSSRALPWRTLITPKS